MERNRAAEHEQPGHDGPVSDLVPEGASAPAGTLARLAYAMGSTGLLAATAADAVAVAGRHTGLHLLGSIELVQTAVVLLAASAMLLVTIARGHASVHIITGRLRGRTAARLARVSALVSAILFLIFAVGSAWLLSELWSGFERTELLHIPIRWLRLLWTVFAFAIAVQFVRNALHKAV